MTETDSSASLHIVGVRRRHSRNFTVRADNALGSDTATVTLTVVSPPSDSPLHQQHVVDNDVVPDYSPSKAQSLPPTSITVSKYIGPGADPGVEIGGHIGQYGEHGARAYSGVLGAVPPAGSRGRAPGQGVRGAKPP